MAMRAGARARRLDRFAKREGRIGSRLENDRYSPKLVGLAVVRLQMASKLGSHVMLRMLFMSGLEIPLVGDVQLPLVQDQIAFDAHLFGIGRGHAPEALFGRPRFLER